jgi:hypothetical protein
VRLAGRYKSRVDASELKRRIDAARTLRGMGQTDLATLAWGDGLGKHDVGRIERGKMDLQRVHREVLVRHLRVPDWWFTAEVEEFDLRLLGLYVPPAREGLPPDEIRAIAAELATLLLRAAEAVDPSAGGERRGSDEPDHPGVDEGGEP